MCQHMKLPPNLARKGEKHSKTFSKSCSNEEQVWILQKGRLQGSSRERWQAAVIGKEYTEEHRSGNLWNSGLKVWLVDTWKTIQCSEISHPPHGDGASTVQQQDCCGSARSEGQWGQGKNCWADRTIYRGESLSSGDSGPEKTCGSVADRKRGCW